MLIFLLVEDNTLFRLCTKYLLQDLFPYVPIMESTSGKDALLKLEHNLFSVAILDINLPGVNGFEIAVYIKKHCPETKIVIMTSHIEEGMYLQARNSGAIGYIVKDDIVEDFQECIENVLDGRFFASRSIKDFEKLFQKKLIM